MKVQSRGLHLWINHSGKQYQLRVWKNIRGGTLRTIGSNDKVIPALTKTTRFNGITYNVASAILLNYAKDME